MSSKLIFKMVKNQLKKQIDEKNPKLLILAVDFETDQTILQTDTGERYEIESPGFNASQLRLLIDGQLNGNEPRRLLLSFYYLEKTKDYISIFFENGEHKTINLYKNE